MRSAEPVDPLTVLVDRVPAGWSSVDYRGRRWALRRSDHVHGRSVSIYAEELGGAGVVSANVYRTSTGDLLKPCEMPAAEVLDFLSGWRPAAPPTASRTERRQPVPSTSTEQR